MAIYSVGIITGVPLTLAPYAGIRTVAANRIVIKQIDLVNTSATPLSIGLARGTNTPVPNANTAVGQQLAPTATAGLTGFDWGWTTAPTIAGTPVYIKRATLAGVVGNGVVWMFPDNLAVDPSSSLVFWNFSGSGGAALQINVTFEE